MATPLQQLAELAHRQLRIRAVATGRLRRTVGLTLEAVGLNAALGSRCRIESAPDNSVVAEVVGFDDGVTYLMPIEPIGAIQAGAMVVPLTFEDVISVGDGLLGRVVNGAGDPLDGKGALECEHTIPFKGKTINPLQRQPITHHLDVGIRSINALLSIGAGQRMGLFAGSGVGKSVLMGMMTRFTEADVVVVGLIGERGREVKEFIDHILGEEGLRRAVVVASPADDAPLMRLRASMLATRYAEHFRDRGLKVLLLMDSLTRFAQAQREIALAVGEPPATKGYPPSVFAKIPQLVERAGNDASGKGSITAFYTVLTEGDDLQDPVADAARAILDGHIVLSRQMAEEGIYPAVDVEASISRAMPNIVSEKQLKLAQMFKARYSRYNQSRDLISVGAYVAGADRDNDIAIATMPNMRAFIQQGLNSAVYYLESHKQLELLCEEAELSVAPSVEPQKGLAKANRP
jgi:flagellum-specific ATP synthase